MRALSRGREENMDGTRRGPATIRARSNQHVNTSGDKRQQAFNRNATRANAGMGQPLRTRTERKVHRGRYGSKQRQKPYH